MVKKLANHIQDNIKSEVKTSFFHVFLDFNKRMRYYIQRLFGGMFMFDKDSFERLVDNLYDRINYNCKLFNGMVSSIKKSDVRCLLVLINIHGFIEYAPDYLNEILTNIDSRSFFEASADMLYFISDVNYFSFNCGFSPINMSEYALDFESKKYLMNLESICDKVNRYGDHIDIRDRAVNAILIALSKMNSLLEPAPFGEMTDNTRMYSDVAFASRIPLYNLYYSFLRDKDNKCLLTPDKESQLCYFIDSNHNKALKNLLNIVRDFSDMKHEAR